MWFAEVIDIFHILFTGNLLNSKYTFFLLKKTSDLVHVLVYLQAKNPQLDEIQSRSHIAFLLKLEAKTKPKRLINDLINDLEYLNVHYLGCIFLTNRKN